MKIRNNIKLIISSITNSYSQIFFSDNKVFAFILLLVSFIDVYAGIAGLVSVVLTNLIAYVLGLDKYKIALGYYGFNSLLVGLGLGIHFAPGFIFYTVLVFAALLTFLISVTTEGVIGKYGLPNLSIPFVLSIWAVTIATREFHFLGLSERWIFSLNEMYLLGGKNLVDIYEWWNNIEIAKSIKIYFYSLGAIVFQYNLFSGILIAIGLLVYSRIGFTLSVIGFYTAYLFYMIIGAHISEAGYSYIGFNYILTAIAIGGYFLIPSPKSYFWVILLIPVVVIVTMSIGSVLTIYRLPAFSMPFNMIVLMFLYILKFRTKRSKSLSEVVLQQNKPERNLYSFKNFNSRFSKRGVISIYLPFYGEWTVTQGHEGNLTHKSNWKHAWDFEITNEEKKTYKNKGNFTEDYYCYGKDVLAPADGIVENIIDDIHDNIIGENNLKQNWGNTIIVRHSDYLFSKLCHLKPGSFNVVIGQRVKQGDILAKVGNSGRSPYPHLHFQLQATPYIGSKTLEYPLNSFVVKNTNSSQIKTYDIPKEHDIVSNIQPNTSLSKAFDLVPGKIIRFEEFINGEKHESSIEAFYDYQGNKYLYCKQSNSFAYYRSDGKTLTFEHFKGSKKSILYFFFLAAYKTQTGLYKDIETEDQFTVNQLKYFSIWRFFQDFIAPFHIFIKTTYKNRYVEAEEDFISSNIMIQSSAQIDIGGGTIKKLKFELKINEGGLYEFIIISKNKKRTIRCIKESSY